MSSSGRLVGISGAGNTVQVLGKMAGNTVQVLGKMAGNTVCIEFKFFQYGLETD